MKKFPTIQGKYASIKVLTKKGLEVKIVFCSIENAKKCGAVLSTDIDLSSEEILNIYIKRWTIEPFFKECKQHLYLGKEQCRNFDSIFASNAIALIRYIFLAVTLRYENDDRILGELFKDIQVDMKNISASQIVIDFITDIAYNKSIKENMHLSVYKQFTQLVDSIKYSLSSLLIFNESMGCET